MAESHKMIWHSKTFWFNTIMTLVSVATLATDYVPVDAVPWLMLVAAIGNAVLRIWFTSEPVKMK